MNSVTYNFSCQLIWRKTHNLLALPFFAMEKESDTVSDDSCVSLDEREEVKTTEADPNNVEFEFKKIGKTRHKSKVFRLGKV